MGSMWTVQPDDGEKVELTWVGAPGGPKDFWIRIKNGLTVGEDRRVRTAGWRGVSRQATPSGQDEADGAAEPVSEIQIDWKATGVVRALIWLTDWSLTDDKDRKLPRTRDGIEALHPDVFELIENAITKHVEALEALKKTPSTPPTSSSVSPPS